MTSGQTVLLAGLISETENKQRQGIPLLDSIPGVGDAFSHQTNTRARTELILFIRPTVIKDAVDAHVIAEEMRSKMNSRLVGTSNPVVVVAARDPQGRALTRVIDANRAFATGHCRSSLLSSRAAGGGGGEPRRGARARTACWARSWPR